jgi:hypothetical protein
MKLKLLFTDLDGTCVHYDAHDFCSVAEVPTAAGFYPCTSLAGNREALLLRLPPSTSGGHHWRPPTVSHRHPVQAAWTPP